MEEKRVTIAFTGGGTGGHIYPALALIGALQAADRFEFFWIGQAAGMDRTVVESAGVRFYGISAGKLRRYASLRNFIDVFKIIRGFFQARAVLRRERPAILFSKGGFVSVPPVLAAAMLGITVHTHESDLSPGLATRINARFAARVWTAYAESERFFAPALRPRLQHSGNPVRAAFRNASPGQGRVFIERCSGQKIPVNQRILLVLGGSQGAQEINNLIHTALGSLTAHYFIVHQTGAGYHTSPAANYLPLPYIHDEIADTLAASDLVLGRSGAGTVWEAAAAGKPMVLIPLAGSGTRGDQVENAAFFVRMGAALSLVHPNAQELISTLTALADNPARLSEMGEASRRIGAQDAAQIIAEALTNELASRVPVPEEKPDACAG